MLDDDTRLLDFASPPALKAGVELSTKKYEHRQIVEVHDHHHDPRKARVYARVVSYRFEIDGKQL